MKLRMLDVWRLWQDPPKGHDAADADEERLVEKVWEALADEHLVDPPVEEIWHHGEREVRVLHHQAGDRVLAWVFKRRQQADRYMALDFALLEEVLREDGITREPGTGVPTAPERRAKEEPTEQPKTERNPAAKREQQQEPTDDQKPPWARALKVDEIQTTWQIGMEGVVPVLEDRNGMAKPKRNSRCTDRPIWPERMGRDLATDDLHFELAWIDPMGRVRKRWVDDVTMRSASALIELPGGPVTDGRHRQTAAWMSYATGYLRRPTVDVTSRAGWLDDEHMIWAWPGRSGIEYIGPELSIHDNDRSRAIWRDALQMLAELGAPGLTAMAAVAISAAAPLSRIHRKRNPVLGYASRTSRGKGSAFGFACSLWCDSEALMAPASSTAKGIQDRAQAAPDLPCWLDELQQLLAQGPRGQAQVSDAIYYLANGVRRVTSSKSQEAVGGERRFGCGMYAAEATVIEGLNAGVQSRVVELTGDPCPSAEVARQLQAAARHGGAWGEIYGRHLEGLGAAQIAQRVETWADNIKSDLADDSRLRGDDCDTVAMFCLGLQLLGDALEIDLPVSELEDYILSNLQTQRGRQVDRESAARDRIIGIALRSGKWKEIGRPRDTRETGAMGTIEQATYFCETNEGLLAWRKVRQERSISPGESEETITEHGTIRLEVNPTHPLIMRTLSEFGGQEHVLAAWHQLGWIEPDGRNRTVQKHHGGSRIGRVIRFTEEAFAGINEGEINED